MKSIKSILILSIGMIAFLNVSCSNESGQNKPESSTLNKEDELIPISPQDAYYSMLVHYGDNLIEKYVAVDGNGERYWTNPSIATLQDYFDINYTNKATVVCHNHSAGNKHIHYVTVLADNGDYYVAMVDTFWNPPTVNLFSFGSYNPCGHQY